MAHAVYDTTISLLLVVVMISIAFSAINIDAAQNVRLNAQAEKNLADYTYDSLAAYLTGRQGYVDPNTFLELANLPSQNSLPPHLTYEELQQQLKLQGISFNLQVVPALSISYALPAGNIAVTVTKPFSKEPVQAAVRVYIWNGTTVTAKLDGQSNIQGSAIFNYQIPQASVAVIFANAGIATGYNATDSTGTALRNGPLYVVNGTVQGGTVQGAPQIIAISVFAFEDWNGPSLLTSFSSLGYSLPVLLVYQYQGQTYISPYPQLPFTVGATPPKQTLTANIQATWLVADSNSIVAVQTTVWGTGEED
jgi:hypothetical protein